jgi:peptide/nickel transport system substrate-binding protein
MDTISRRDLLAGAAGLALTSALGGTAAGQAARTPKRGGTLVGSWGGFEPQALFVPPGGGSSPNMTSTKVLERLIRLDEDLQFRPVLALSVTPAADFRSYTIKLRPNVKWHDGADFTADDVVFNAMDYWKPISSGGALNALVGAEAVDKETVVLKFNATVPEFFLKSILAGRTVTIPKHIYAGKELMTNPANNLPIGTGPFKVREWVRGSHVEYVRNENYWDPQLPYADKLVIRWWRDPASRSAAFEAGQLDFAVFNPIPAPDVKRLVDTRRFTAVTEGYKNTAWALTTYFNTQREIFKRADVRRALLHAVDREFISDTIYFGRAKPATGHIPSSNSLFYFKDLPTYSFDPDQAGKLLDAAGYPIRNGSRFTMNIVSAGWFEENVKAGQYLRQAFEDIGVKVDLAIPDRATSLKRIYTDYEFDMAISNNSGPLELAPQWTQSYTTSGIVKGAAFRNASRYSNPALDKLVDQYLVETDPKKRQALAREFQLIVATEAPVTSLVEIVSATVARSDVKVAADYADVLGESWAHIWLDR